MSTAALTLEATTIHVAEEITVRASIESTFAALLDQLGPYNETQPDRPMPMKLEAWPGGRWYRDLGDNNGHFWGTVQAIKKPTLLEICGPLFMSHPVTNNVQYRLSEEPGGTLIKFRHSGFGLVQEDHRKGVVGGWSYIHGKVRERAESSHSK